MFISKIGGNFYNEIGYENYSSLTQLFIANSLAGLARINDNHAHLCGTGIGDGCFVNPLFHMITHPKKYIHYKVFESACGLSKCEEEKKSEEYIKRLENLIDDVSNITKNAIPYKMTLLAMDYWYDEDGLKREDKTAISCPSEYVIDTCNKNPKNFSPCVSVHPYRKDALEVLDKYGRSGISVVKWLPNSMNIDMNSDKLIPYYDVMRNHNMKLLAHVGDEHSVDCGHMNNTFGNPLLLRKPLECGVKIVAAHCASEGKNIDFESDEKCKVDNFDLFMRLMNDSRYDGKLFADVSAMIGFKRLGTPLDTAITDKKLQSRLLFGSDYPVPCLNIVVNLSMLEKYGYINSDEGNTLREIYYYNPLLFNFVTFRTLKKEHPDTKEICKFSNEVFENSIHDL